jgi:hypothetical protein
MGGAGKAPQPDGRCWDGVWVVPERRPSLTAGGGMGYGRGQETLRLRYAALRATPGAWQLSRDDCLGTEGGA